MKPARPFPRRKAGVFSRFPTRNYRVGEKKASVRHRAKRSQETCREEFPRRTDLAVVPRAQKPGNGVRLFPLSRGPSITHVEWCRTKQPGQLPKPSLHNQRNNTIIHLILKMGLEPPELHRRAPGSDDCIRGKAVRQGHSVPCLYQHLLACEGVAPPLYLAGRVQCPRRASRMAYCNFTDVRFATASVQLQPLATGPIEAKFLASTQADGDLSGVDERHN